MTYPHLTRPLAIGQLHIPNRLVVPPMVLRKAGEDGMINPEILAHYRGMPGAGWTVVEASVVSPEGRLAREQIGIFDDRHIAGLRTLAETIHANGAVASIQIHHAGRQTSTKNTFGVPLVAPSAPDPAEGASEGPHALTEPEIVVLIGRFAAAARRAKEAGFDAVEIHGAHGYLISQFLSPLANRRSDHWGGCLENRVRFLREVLAAIRAATQDSLTAYCRLGVADNDLGGLSLAEGIQVARWLEEDGVPILSVSHGIGGPPKTAPADSAFSGLFHLGDSVRKAVQIPVIAVGDIRRPEEAEAALAAGLADLVAVGRGLLADPLWAVKTLEGRAGQINPCRNCRRCHHFINPSRCPARTAGLKTA